MDKSLRIRKQKALARARDRRRLAKGKLRITQVSLAASAENIARSPLILRRVKIPEYDY